VSVVVEKSSGRAVEQGLVSGTLDLGIAFAPPEDSEVAADTLFEEEIVLIVASSHPLADRASVRLAELDGLDMVLHGRGFATRRLLDDRMREAGLRPRITVEMNDIDSLLEVVRLGTGATVLSRRAVNDPRGLVLVPITEPRMSRTAALLWHRDSYRGAAWHAFAGVVREVSGSGWPGDPRAGRVER
jgi:LysR family cyn operon transcriptional activator